MAGGGGDWLAYYKEKSQLPLQHWTQHHSRGDQGSRSSCSPANHQIEKDERFWVVGALMAAFHAPDRTRALVEILESAIPEYPGLPALDGWAAALADDRQPLQLYFEVTSRVRRPTVAG